MGLKKEALLETYLKDIILSKDEMELRENTNEPLFELKENENSIGFITLFDLKAYVSEHEDEAINYQVRSIESKEWNLIFEHPLFQRRKPHIVSDNAIESEDDQEFYILKKGQKVGPFTKNALSNLVSEKEILLTDMVSTNAGHTWLKLYHVDGFDRRTFKDSEQLPGIPSNELMNKSVEKSKKIGETTDAITSLAYLGNLKRGKAVEQSAQTNFQEELPKKALASHLYKLMSLISIIGIIYFLVNIKSQIGEPLNNENENVIGEQSDAKFDSGSENQIMPFDRNDMDFSRNNGINDQSRKSKYEVRKLRPIRAANSKKSFMDTQTYRDTQDSNTNGSDENYYYDNNSPMELDPIRSQISKENFEAEAELNTEPAPAPGGNETLFNQDNSN